jgi:hypothetical protein
MADAPVSLSHPYIRETPRHPTHDRDGCETASETADLKVLARLVLARDTHRDTNRDRLSRTVEATEAWETNGGTSVTLTPQETEAYQSIAPVSLSRALGTETPETLTLVTVSPETLAAPCGEVEEERAAIVEHDGGIRRAWAEGFARLHPDRPPGDVPTKRWLTFIDDIGRFLDSPFCAVAAALGWGPYDLFGCDRDRPFARIDQAGLLWLLNGDKLIALSENTATTETRTGARQTYCRKACEPSRVLAWELTRL